MLLRLDEFLRVLRTQVSAGLTGAPLRRRVTRVIILVVSPE